jgi:site-specific DNA-cytosine methylase
MSIANYFRKRRAEEPLDRSYDGAEDCIAVASRPRSSPRSADGSTDRKPLGEANVLQSQNKRRRVLDCVLLPGTPPKVSRRPPSSSKARSAVQEPNSDDEIVQRSSLSAKKQAPPGPASSKTDAWSAFSAASGFNLQRPRRSAARVSYAPLADSGSDDELAASSHVDAPASRRKTASKRNKNEDDDIDFDISDNAPLIEDEEDEFAAHDSMSIAESDSESGDSDVDEDVDEDAATRRTIRKPAVAKANKAAPSKKVQKASADDMKSLLTRGKGQTKGLATGLPPLCRIEEIFDDLTTSALSMGLAGVTKRLDHRRLRVATMCSGTESPLLALELVADNLKQRGLPSIEVDHVFSAEIVPYKQAYIERNFSPPIIFRNIVEFIEAFQEDEPTATTAYGGRMTIPRDVDVLIAGTSCVDYSALNNKKKGIEDEGESGLTWHGALAYCRVCRPAIIIFENVIGADWKSMLQHYREIGYDCRGVYANTKDYYIPQTRQRGYMVCFDINGRDNPSGSMSKQWQEKMGEFRRFASSPVSSFLIPTDQVVQRLQARDDEKLREVDWSTCEITQMAYREDKRLGTARPFTGWTEAGTMSVPDNASSSWYRRQVERVLDTIDCSTLRKAHEGYDARYKTRVWDLSQNIYRFTDRSPFGVSGCITPDGIFFISDAGREFRSRRYLLPLRPPRSNKIWLAMR